ncbi:hypothetical protein B0H16DRAFT_1729982 [Mycena metata]|uniref:Oxidoreductase N-terminal domain-containing protein n=1 Tax=Mycena metata TaxID=1033252 RepID=A0AAD7MYT1_9AGAR|nr:hypothetical protein B0H16DRAFT_1729982 [Mycena metata]
MAPVTNGRELFNEIVPAGELPTPGKTTVYDTSETIDLDTVPLSGRFLVKTLALSMDPLLFPSMRPPQKGQPMPPFPIGKPIMGVGIGVVLRSEYEGVEVGSYAYGALSHQEYSVVPTLRNPMQPVEIIKKNKGNSGFESWKGGR